MNFSDAQLTAVRNYLQRQNDRQTFRFLVVGSSDSGKDSFLLRLLWNHPELSETYDPTLMEPTYQRHLSIQGNDVILEAETSHSHAKHMVKQMAAKAEAFVLLYSVGDRESFISVTDLHQELWGPAAEAPKPKLIFVAANKTDLSRDRWGASLEEGKEFSTRIGAKFLTISAKSGLGCGLDDAIAIATRIILGRIEAEKEHEAEQGQSANTLPSERPKKVSVIGGIFRALKTLFRNLVKRSR